MISMQMPCVFFNERTFKITNSFSEQSFSEKKNEFNGKWTLTLIEKHERNGRSQTIKKNFKAERAHLLY